MDTDGDHKTAPAAGGATGVGLLPEIEAYAYLLVVMYLVDQKAYQEVNILQTPSSRFSLGLACVCLIPRSD